MDRRVERARERAALESAPRPLAAPDARRLEDMERRADEALGAAEGAGEAGDVLAALDAAGAGAELRAAAARSRQQLTHPERVLSVCDVCGIFVSSTDNEARRTEHVTGKQYQGWKRIRDALRDMEEGAAGGAGGRAGAGTGRSGSREPFERERERERRSSPGADRGWAGARGGGGGRHARDGGGGGGGGWRGGVGGEAVPPPVGLYPSR